MPSMSTRVGLCSVNPDSNSTSPNPWSWTRESDILFIDQPVQTGFSYDELTNATIDYSIGGQITPANFDHGIPAVNHTFGVGVFGSQDYNGTVNSTANGARELWEFMQAWLNEFVFFLSGVILALIGWTVSLSINPTGKCTFGRNRFVYSSPLLGLLTSLVRWPIRSLLHDIFPGPEREYRTRTGRQSIICVRNQGRNPGYPQRLQRHIRSGLLLPAVRI